MKDRLSAAAVEQSLHTAFVMDIRALKPGNVHAYAAGHDMTAADFERSAEVSVPCLLRSDRSPGERLHDAVAATRAAVGCNTNLGMLLLALPLVLAVQRPGQGSLQARVRDVLRSLDEFADAGHFFAAIRLAAPGGLGETEQHDVNKAADVSVITAMCAAQHRDRVARQYASDYADIFAEPLNVLRDCKERWHSVEWSLVACYLSFLTQFSDSHITRKYGESVARDVRQQGDKILTSFLSYRNPEEAASELLEFDAQLKAEAINPGTSADLSVTCLLVSELEERLTEQ
ncbi:triphosphoribosyl-dephospho-CoA synthase [Methylohalomonas lacus]|uniref:Triphosphoribosyl-dephospho-CoA synthase n=1 Tax=Methylohalomonas lacus TaxID=398773 RepID=A0AAE3HPG9_9GAMM|nr:triphosphoribosyl-dephospho-CoA synthase [Methylohalomonas lacus]MCS3904468.1 triphosphoribosyl-dephospho-CoA synthase [Methylohalomonas lacus]